MALARVKTWIAAEVLFASDLNAEFDNILNNPISLISPFTSSVDAGGFDITAIDELGLSDASSVPTSGRMRRNGNLLQWRIEGSHTDSVLNVLSLIATTSGTPAAGIGTGLVLRAESADENPSDVAGVQGVFTDIGAGTEDSDVVITARTGGAALAEIGRLASDGGFRPGATAPSAPVANYLYRDSIIKAWAFVENSAGTPSIGDDVNVASLTDNGVGDVTVTYATAMASVTYAAAAMVMETGGGPFARATAVATGSIRLAAITHDSSAVDVDFSVIVTGEQ